MDDGWINTVRLARDLGSLESLFPAGIERLVDLPYTLHSAILAALGFLTFEELPEDERPPKSMWLDGKRMKRWWDEVKRLRQQKMEGVDTDGSSRNALLDLLE